MFQEEENKICRIRSTGQGKPVRYDCRFGINLKAVFTKRRLLVLPRSFTFLETSHGGGAGQLLLALATWREENWQVEATWPCWDRARRCQQGRMALGRLACPPHGSSICNAKMQNEFFFFIFFFLSKPAAQNCFGKGFILLSVAHSCSLKEGKLTEAMKPGSATNTVGLLIHRKYTYILMWVCTLTS